MKHVMARYRVKPEKVEQLKRVVSNFVDSVRANEPRTVLYVAFQEKDSLWFVHLMTFEDEQAQRVHEQSTYGQNFVEMLYPNCEEVPVFTELVPVRSPRS